MNEKEIYKELLIDKTKRVESIVRKAKDVIGIDQENGEPIILVSRTKLTDKEMIGLYLVGKYFASEIGLAEASHATPNEISQKVGADATVVSARLHDLKNEGFVRSPSRGTHEIIFAKIDEFLDIVRKKAGID